MATLIITCLRGTETLGALQLKVLLFFIIVLFTMLSFISPITFYSVNAIEPRVTVIFYSNRPVQDVRFNFIMAIFHFWLLTFLLYFTLVNKL